MLILLASRFIPQRSSTDLAASFQLLEPAYGAVGAGGHGKNGERGERDPAKRVGGAIGEIDAMKGEREDVLMTF